MPCPVRDILYAGTKQNTTGNPDTGAALGHFRACQHRLSDGLFHRAGGFLMDEEGHQTAAAHLLQYHIKNEK